MTHACFGSVGFRTAPGDQFDCPDCRVRLLEAFREPAQAAGPWAVQPVAQEPESGCMEPELCTAADPCPVCEPDDELAPPGPHALQHRVTGGMRRGVWEARCSCGWSVRGHWGLGPLDLPNWVTSRPMAQAEAERRCAEHWLANSGSHVVHGALDDTGAYKVTCSCGWTRTGTTESRETALRLVQAWTEEHKRNPIKEQ